MKNYILFPCCNTDNALTYEEQVLYFKDQLLSGTYPEKEFCILNKKGQILHGDALFEALKRLNLPVVFMVVENKHADFIIQYSNVYSGLMKEKNYVSPADVKEILGY